MRSMGKIRLGAASTVTTLLVGAAAAAAAPVPCYGIGGLQDALSAASPGSTVQLIAGSDCQHTAYTLPSASITLDGTGSTLDGTGIVPTGTLPILSGADVQGTTIKNLTFVNGSLNSGDGAAIDLTGDSHPTLNNDQ